LQALQGAGQFRTAQAFKPSSAFPQTRRFTNPSAAANAATRFFAARDFRVDGHRRNIRRLIWKTLDRPDQRRRAQRECARWRGRLAARRAGVTTVQEVLSVTTAKEIERYESPNGRNRREDCGGWLNLISNAHIFLQGLKADGKGCEGA